jgi:hypothetical protein
VNFLIVVCFKRSSVIGVFCHLVRVVIRSPLVHCVILCGVLFLVVSVCCLYVCLCVVLATSRRELFVGAED